MHLTNGTTLCQLMKQIYVRTHGTIVVYVPGGPVWFSDYLKHDMLFNMILFIYRYYAGNQIVFLLFCYSAVVLKKAI